MRAISSTPVANVNVMAEVLPRKMKTSGELLFGMQKSKKSAYNKNVADRVHELAKYTYVMSPLLVLSSLQPTLNDDKKSRPL